MRVRRAAFLVGVLVPGTAFGVVDLGPAGPVRAGSLGVAWGVDGSGQATFVRSSPSGSLIGVTLAPGSDARAGVKLVSGDFNGDGKLDLATFDVANGHDGITDGSVMYADALGRITSKVPFLIPDNTAHLVAADVNGDGRTDLVTTGSQITPPLTGVWVSLSLPGGGFDLTYSGGSQVGFNTPLVADFTGDGKPDLAGLDQPCPVCPITAVLAVGNGATFGASQVIGDGGPVDGLFVGGLQPSGGRDLILTTSDDPSVGQVGRVQIHRPAGDLSELSGLPSGASFQVASADFDVDGRQDLLVSTGSPSVLVYAGTASGYTLVGSASTNTDGEGVSAMAVVRASPGKVVFQTVSGIASLPYTAPTPIVVPPAQTRGGSGGAGALSATDSLVDFAGQGINTLTGAVVEGSVDLVLAGRGLDFSFERTYNSDDSTVGPLGAGWTHNFAGKAIVETNGDVSVVDGDGARVRFVKNTSGLFDVPAGLRSTLEAVSGGGWVLRSPDLQVSTFDASGRLASEKDQSGEGLSFTYTGGRLSGVSDAGGRVVSFTYTGALLSSVILPDGRHADFTYAAGRLTQAKDATGAVTAYTYATVAAGGRLLTVRDPLGKVVRRLVYNAAGRAIDETDAVAKHTLVAWDAGTQTASITDPDLGVSKDVYEGNILVRQIDPRGTVTGASEADYTTSYQRDDTLSPWTTATPGGRVSRTFVDGNRNPEVVRDALGHESFTTFDARNNPASVVDRLGNTTTNTYDSAGRLASTVNPERGRRSFTYTPTGQVESVTYEDGNVVSYEYDANGHVITFGGLTGLTTYTYDSAGRRVTETDPRGKTSSYEYNARDQITKITDPVGAITTFVFDAAGRTTSQTDPVGGVTAWVYDAEGRVVSVTDPRGGITRTAYDPAGRVTSTTTATGSKTTYTYDLAGHVLSMTKPKGNVTGALAADFTWTYTYDKAGNQLTRSFPGTGTTTTTYDLLNRATSVTDPAGHTTQVAYDAEGRPTSQTDQAGNISQTVYDAVGRVTQRRDRRGYVATSRYDSRGLPTEQTDRAGGRTTLHYDGTQRLVDVTDPRGKLTQYTYDENNNVLSVTDPLGHTTTSTYDNANRRVTQTDANGHATTYGYDLAGRLTSVTGPDAPPCSTGPECVNNKRSTVYTLDPAGNLTSRVDPNAHVTTTGFDLDNRPLLVTSPLGQRWSYTYDKDGNQVTKTTARGNAATNPATGRIAYTYDTSDRVTKTNYPGTTTPDVTYNYDPLGRRTSITDGTGTTAYTYNIVGYPTVIDQGAAGGAFTYTYDNEGNALTRTRPDGSVVTTVYDGESRPTQITGPTGEFNLTYDLAGNLTQTTLPATNGYTEKRTYDPAGRLTVVSNENATTVLSRFTQTLDPAGNPTRIDTQRGATTTTDAYTYTPANRLAKYCLNTITCTGATDTTDWTYDPVGNRLTQTHTGPSTTPPTLSYTYNEADQLTQTVTASTGGPVTTTYTYDPDGNQTTSGADTNAYDYENRLITATRGATINRYTYDADGKRYQRKLANTVKATWAWDTINTLPELALEKNTAGIVVRSYLQGPVGGLTETTAAGTTFLHHDLIGSTVDATNATGTATYAYQYHPFGEERTRSVLLTGAVEPAQRFAGESLDAETGAYHLRARQYEPATGRFTATDPLPPETDEPYLGAYQYAAGQPTRLVDPSGQDPDKDYCIIFFQDGCSGHVTIWGFFQDYSYNTDVGADGPRAYVINGLSLVGEESLSTVRNPANLVYIAVGGAAAKIGVRLCRVKNVCVKLTRYAGEKIAAGGQRVSKWIVDKTIGRRWRPGARAPRGAAKAGAKIDVDALSAAGTVPVQGGRTAAGRSYQKHMDRGELPVVPGKSLNDAGQQLLDDILRAPGSVTRTVKAGNAAGGVRVIRPDGQGVTFNPDGSLAYFGVYK